MRKIFFAVLFILTTIFATQTAVAMPLSRKVIVLDAGHGGWDPGTKQGGTDEKDVNLSVVKKLQTFLEQGGATVIVTRIDDSHLAKSKSGDMHARRVIANSAHADIFVSVHQNSFGQESVHGAQTFYFNTSDNSEKLANLIQDRLREIADPSNKFDAKANSNYFVLKQTSMPAVLVECGFLSNYAERTKLLTDDYQEKIAWGIYLGIIDYFHPPAAVAPEEDAS